MLNVKSLEETLNILMKKFDNCFVRTVTIGIDASQGRVLAKDIYCSEDLPPFNRATMDGYAVKAEDTFGASTTIPAILNLAGNVRMGEYAAHRLNQGQACSIPTGGILPDGADSVVMVEYTESPDAETVLVEKPVFPGENVIKKGEDIRKGELMFAKGHRLRPQDVGTLALAGITEVKVFDRFIIAVVSSGDEIVSPFDRVSPGKVRDINSYSLSAAICKDGFCPVPFGIVKDSFNDLKDTMESALEAADIVLLSGGSSVGAMDMTYKVIESLEESDIFIHGVAIKPGKPVIIARVGTKAVFGLPGHPVSAFIVYNTLISKLLADLMGAFPDLYTREAFFSDNYASSPGRDEFVMVRLAQDEGRTIACPVYVKSGMIATMSRAQGYVHIPASKEGVYKGEKVLVSMF